MATDSGFKAQPDVGTLAVAMEASGDNKVALDIEDAPFLKDWNESKPSAPATQPASGGMLPVAVETDPVLAAAQKKKKRLMILTAALVLMVIIVALWWFKFRTPPPPPVVVEPEIIRVPGVPKDIAPKEYIVNFAPYWIELPDGKGGVVFLVCKFAAITHSEMLLQEAQNKMLTLRDAVYYYLRNKPYHFLIDPTNTPTIKSDLNSVLSGYLAGGKIDDMLFESYLGK